MDAEKRKAALYTRVSTEDQAKEGFSLDAQLEKLNAYCTARGWDIADIYVDDGYSGRNIRRPAYTRLIEDMDSWDTLLVIKMDRIHRNSKNFMIMMEKLKEQNKEFVSMTESLDTSTAMGRFVMDIIQRIAQLESEQIGERVYDGMEQKARTNGGSLGFNIPYGYEYQNKTLVINPKEKEQVKRIFDLYLQGWGMKKIADFFNENQIPTKQKRSWGSQTISRILKNPLYCGMFHWEDYTHEGAFPEIISVSDFKKVQNMIKNKCKKKIKKQL